jgi:hypothetical protein
MHLNGAARDQEEVLEVLRRPLEVYSPFSQRDASLLRAYVANLRELATYSFFRQVPSELRLSAARGEPLESRMRDPPPEATRAAAALFRQVYWHREPANFDKTMKLLKASAYARDSNVRDAAITDLEGLHHGQKEILDYGMGIALNFSDGRSTNRLTSQEILATYLNGVWLHSSNSKSQRAQRLDQAPPVARFTFYGVILLLTNLYWVGANVVDLVLAEPELVPVAGERRPGF